MQAKEQFPRLLKFKYSLLFLVTMAVGSLLKPARLGGKIFVVNLIATIVSSPILIIAYLVTAFLFKQDTYGRITFQIILFLTQMGAYMLIAGYVAEKFGWD